MACESHTTPLVGTLVTCNGIKSALQVDQDGTVTYAPLRPRHGSRGCCACCGCQTQHLKQQISGWHVVGAALESPNSFRVWYCTPPSHTDSSTAAPKFKLHKTPPYVCCTGSEASSLVQRVRQVASWHGSDKAPRVVAIINPHSGRGKSLKLFQQQVAPVLEGAAGMALTSLVTAHPGHASHLTAELDLGAVDLLVFVGGDGTVFEGLQGLLSRPDWQRARLLPIAHVPGGSGNGLAHSCGLQDPTTAAYALCKGVVSPMDVASVLQPPNSRLYMMLSTSYGLMSNLDKNTEFLRWMGDVRFTLGTLWEIMKNQSYNASIAWLPAEEPGIPKAAAAAAGEEATSSSESGCADTYTAPSTSSSNAASPSGPPELPVSSRGGAATPGPAAAGGGDQQDHFVSLQDFPPGPDLPLLQQLGQLPLTVPQQPAAASCLPPGWQVWHEPLQMWSLFNPPFIAASYKANPLGQLHSGHMNMMWVHGLKGLRGRLAGLDMQARSQQGLHITAPCVTQHKVCAMMFEPRDSNTYLMLDGELVPSAPIYLEVHKGLIRVLINPAHHSEPAADSSRAGSATAAPV